MVMFRAPIFSRPAPDRPIDELAVNCHCTGAGFGRLQHAVRPVDAVRARRKTGVYRIDLRWMNAELAAKSIPSRTRDICLQDVGRVDGDGYALNGGGEPCEATFQRQLCAHEVEFWTLSLDAGLQAEIDRAEREPRQARRSGNRAQVGDTAHGFHQADKALVPGEFRARRGDGLDAFRLRKHQSDDPRQAGHRKHVVIVPRRRDRVDAHHDFGSLSAFQPIDQTIARRGLGVGSHRVFQIDDDSIRTRRERLDEPFRAIGWNEQEAAFKRHRLLRQVRPRAIHGERSVNS